MQAKLKNLFIFLLLLTPVCYAQSVTDSVFSNKTTLFVWLIFCIVLSRAFSFVKKFGVSILIGEIFAGICIGNAHLLGIHIFDGMVNNPTIEFLSELGALILMLQIGLECSPEDIKLHGIGSGIVALAGTILTFVSGFLVAKYLIHGSTLSVQLLVGLVASATATGISAKVFKDMKLLHLQEIKVILVAALIDDLFSIICFGIISSFILASKSNISHSLIDVGVFFLFSLGFKILVLPNLLRVVVKIDKGINMKLGLLMGICFLFAWVANLLGIAPALGAFVAGIILDKNIFDKFSNSKFLNNVHDQANEIKEDKVRQKLIASIKHEKEKSLHTALKPLAYVFTPIFFIYTGLLLNLSTLVHLQTIILSLSLFITTFISRFISGYFCINKPKLSKALIGIGMPPIGEAGLIFTLFARTHGIMSNDTVAAIIAAVVMSSIIIPISVKIIFKYSLKLN